MTKTAPEPVSPSGVKVVVVGLGLAGLSTAIECHRNGHSVIVLERVTKLRQDAGDGILIAPNAACIIRQWGTQVQDAIAENQCDSTHAEFFDHCDRFIVRHEVPGKGQGFVTNRGKLVAILYEHAKRIGIDIRLGAQVSKYYETQDEAGVIVNGTEHINADCIVCADGVHGIAREFIVGNGHDVQKRETGWATFRAHMRTDTAEFAKDPDAQWVLEGTEKGDRTYMWFGEGVNMAMMTLKHGKELVWMTTHRDCYQAQETWTGGGAHARMEDALDSFGHWPGKHRIESVIRHTDPKKLVNHPLVYRPPLQTWISPGGRAILIGDAAHPYYPVVGQGGAQGIEDGAVIAAALTKAGKSDVPLALQVVEKIRYPRASVIQLGSATFQASVLSPDWDAVAKDPGIFRFPNPAWIFDHNCQEYTYQQYDNIVESIKAGVEYVPTNIPKDGVYRVEDTYNS